jgi:hypothetical protein
MFKYHWHNIRSSLANSNFEGRGPTQYIVNISRMFENHSNLRRFSTPEKFNVNKMERICAAMN